MKNLRTNIPYGGLAAALLGAGAYSTLTIATAYAQDAEILAADNTLPPIVVEGTTIAPKPARKAKRPTATQTVPVPADRGKIAARTATSSDVPASSGQPLNFEDAEAAFGSDVEYVEAGRILNNQGGSVSVVTAEDLNRQQVRHAADALRSLPGVAISRSGGPQSITSVRIRGAESNHTLVLIDGVEVNAADGAFDFANLTADDIEQIEVLRGPQSALFSSGALGGVVNIRTKSGKGPLTVRVRSEIGTMNSQNGSLQIGGGSDKLHGIATFSGYHTDGFNLATSGNEDDGATFSNMSFAGGVELFPGLKIDGSLRRSRTDGDRDDFGPIGSHGFEELGDTKSEFDSILWVGRLAATLDTFDGKWVHRWQIGGTKTDLYDIGRGSFAGTGSFVTERFNYSYRSTVTLDSPAMPGIKHFLTGLVEHQTEDYDQVSRSSFSDTIVSEEMARTGYAAELRGEYFNSLFLSAAVRHDDNDSFEDFSTWNTSASYRLPGNVFRLHGAVGSGVKYPSLLELYGEFGPTGFVGNPNLRPEESIGWEAGIETTLFGGRAVVDVTYFSQKLENEIFTAFSPVYTVDNRDGESDREGIEVQGRFNVAAGLDVGVAYTYLRAREDTGLEEIRRPPHSGRVDVNYRFLQDRANINLAVAYSGETFDENFNFNSFTTERLLLDDYWLVTLAGSYKLAPGIEVYGRVENLLDQDYTEIIGIDSAPVAAYAGFKLTYGGEDGIK